MVDLEKEAPRDGRVVVVGNGDLADARAFAEEFRVRLPLYTDPDRRTYRAVGFKHGLLSVADPRVALRAAERLREGVRQGRVMGDAFQQGGAVVITPDGRAPFVHVNAYAGDDLPPARLLAELARA